MADVLRIVTFTPGGRPVEKLNLNSAPGTVTAYFRDKGSFQFTPAAGNVQYSRRAKRYGGARAVGQTHDNGTIVWTAYVRGTTLATAVANVEALLGVIEDTSRGRFVEWAPEGGNSSYMEIAGPGTWTPTYDPVEFVQTNAMRVQLTFPVYPLVRWARMSINDPPTIDSSADYTFDALTTASFVWNGGAAGFGPGGINLTTERRARHTARGYTMLEGQATLWFQPGATITSFKAGVIMRATSANNYIDVYVDDNGTNSRLRIDAVVGGVRTNRATTNLGARLVTGNLPYVRGRIEGNIVYAEYWVNGTTPSPMATPTTSINYTLVVGDAPLNTTPGYVGWDWIPQANNSAWESFDFRFAWRNLTWPRTLAQSDTIPGTAPAQCDVTITPFGGATAPAFALVSWTQLAYAYNASLNGPVGIALTTGSVTGTLPFTASATGFAVGGADATALAGAAFVHTTSGVETDSATWAIDPSALAPDLFDDEVSLEVWARIKAAVTIVTPTVALSAKSRDGVGATRYSDEWGSTGRTFTPSGFWQFHRLGAIRLPVDQRFQRTIDLTVAVTTGTGSTGTLMLDYVVLVLANQRALSPSSKHLDSTYPTFVGATTEIRKMIRTDLSGMAAASTGAFMPDHGLGGSLVEPLPGAGLLWLIKLSSGVPDDTSPPASNEQLTHSATLELDYTPRSYMLRL